MKIKNDKIQIIEKKLNYKKIMFFFSFEKKKSINFIKFLLFDVSNGLRKEKEKSNKIIFKKMKIK